MYVCVRECNQITLAVCVNRNVIIACYFDEICVTKQALCWLITIAV